MSDQRTDRSIDRTIEPLDAPARVDGRLWSTPFLVVPRSLGILETQGDYSRDFRRDERVARFRAEASRHRSGAKTQGRGSGRWIYDAWRDAFEHSAVNRGESLKAGRTLMFWRRKQTDDANVEEARQKLEETLKAIPVSEQKDREAEALHRRLKLRYQQNHFGETFARALAGRDLHE